MSKFHAVGIDLGTTYSVVARLDENGKTQIVRNFHGDILTPSVVLFDDQEIIVGKEAKKAAATEGDRVAECVKRDMGNEFFSKPIRGEKLPPEVIQACILRKLAADAVRVCGNEIKVVITVPAYFDEPRRKATADAGAMAGLDVLDIVNEPTAAALSYGEHLGYLDPQGSPKGDMKVLVYDLGGGTFDATVIEFSTGHIRTLATDGDVRLGGRDWDARVADYLAEKFLAQHGSDPRQNDSSLTRLMRAIEDAKHTLTARTVANVRVEHAGKTLDLELTREKFEELTEDLLERTAYTTRQVLLAANTKWQYISHVLLVGGSTRMPMVAKMLERYSGMKPEHVVNPDEAVARGAAIYAGYLIASRGLEPDATAPAQYKVTDVNAHSLGIEGIDQLTRRKENIVLIPRNTPLPFRAEEKFVTKSAGQKSVVVQVLEGESKVPEQCSRIARAVMRQLPQDLPQGYPIEVIYEYGANGRLSVHAKVVGTKQDLRIELERERGMNDARLTRWKHVVTAEKGFDAFESLLEEVLQLEGMDEPAAKAATAPAARPAAQPFRDSQTDEPAKPSVGSTASSAATPPSLKSQSTTSEATAAAQTLAPSIAVAKPAAATPTPQQSFNPAPAKRAAQPSQLSSIFNLVMHVVGPLLGLAMGYYILCWLRPEANVLQLTLPGLPPPAASTPAVPTPPTPLQPQR